MTNKLVFALCASIVTAFLPDSAFAQAKRYPLESGTRAAPSTSQTRAPRSRLRRRVPTIWRHPASVGRDLRSSQHLWGAAA